jgi:stage IV sporulation protein B
LNVEGLNFETLNEKKLNEKNFFGAKKQGCRKSLSVKLVLTIFVLSILVMPQAALAYDVVVGGQSLGIVLKSEGAIVVGFTPVITEDGSEVYPAKDAGVAVEDMLVAINGEPVSYNQEVADLVNKLCKADEPITLTLKRDGKEIELDVTPQLCSETGLWRLGLYIRDANAGIGTLTFYDPNTGDFAALGHRIENNEESSEGRTDGIGRVLAADVQYVKSSRDGEPGEKVGVFDNTHLSGIILKNSDLGIYGKLSDDLVNELYPEELPIAAASEVEVGEATILTVLEGEELEEFAIEIEKVMPQKRSGDKGMVIKVTDERLLAKVGGIVQGMSGSPIIQNGKLVGAVTHVFVNDSGSGYGCFAEWMLDELQSVESAA